LLGIFHQPSVGIEAEVRGEEEMGGGEGCEEEEEEEEEEEDEGYERFNRTEVVERRGSVLTRLGPK